MRTLTLKNFCSRKFLSLTFAFVFAATLLFAPAKAHAHVFLSVGIAPPVFPMNAYYQPMCPGDGYMWTPGYYSYQDDGGYFWVPGAWVMAPYVGALWTPGYWGFGDGFYRWHGGYWGTTVGYYGGFNYGGGYYGHGYIGGHWDHGGFYYNRSVNNLDSHSIRNAYGTPRSASYGGMHAYYRGGNFGGARANGGYANHQLSMRSYGQSRSYNQSRGQGQSRSQGNSGNSRPTARSYAANNGGSRGGGGGGFHGGGGSRGGGGHGGGGGHR